MAIETILHTEGTYLGMAFRIASNNRDVYHQEIIKGIDGCLLDLIEQSIATDSALCIGFLAALIDASACTNAPGPCPLTQSLKHFQVLQ